MTDEMLDLARQNAREAGVDNVEFVEGYIEDIPLADASVDVVISNCGINLSADKRKVLAEAARLLRPGGRFAVSDVIADPDMDEATRADMQQWTGCVAGALTRGQFEQALAEAGLRDIEVRETHRVHEHASSAIVRARKPDQSRRDRLDDAVAQGQAADPLPLGDGPLDATGYRVNAAVPPDRRDRAGDGGATAGTGGLKGG
jgi:SAM-dependent methyltransferase